MCTECRSCRKDKRCRIADLWHMARLQRPIIVFYTPGPECCKSISHALVTSSRLVYTPKFKYWMMWTMCMYIAEWWILLLVAGLCMQCVNVVLKTRNFNLKTSQQVTCIKRQASCSPVPHFLWSISEIWQHIWLISYKHTSLQLTTQCALCACCFLLYIFEHWMDYTLLKTAMLLLMNSFSTKPIKKHNGTKKTTLFWWTFTKWYFLAEK